MINVCFEGGDKIEQHSGINAVAAIRLGYGEHVSFEVDCGQAKADLLKAMNAKVEQDLRSGFRT